MKKQKIIFVIIFICTLLFMNISIFAELSDDVYTDNKSHISFNIPIGWTEKPIDGNKTTDLMLKNDKDSTVLISYLSTDVWNMYTEDERQNFIDSGYSRSDIDNTIFPIDEYISEFEDSNTTVQTYNGHEFYVVTFQYTQELYGNSVSMPITQLITVYNGYMHIFQFMGNSEAELYPDFIELVNNIDFGTVQPDAHPANPLPTPQYTNESNSNGNNIMLNILIGLIVTIAIYSLPITIFRYCIYKKPLSPQIAKKVTIIYAIISSIIMILVKLLIFKDSGHLTAIWLWSFVNYKTLTSGYKKPVPYFMEDEEDGS